MCGKNQRQVPVLLVCITTCPDCYDNDLKNHLNEVNNVCLTCGFSCSKCPVISTGKKVIYKRCPPEYDTKLDNFCGSRIITFKGEDCVKKFINFIYQKRYANYLIFASNGGKFDHIFLLKVNILNKHSF